MGCDVTNAAGQPESITAYARGMGTAGVAMLGFSNPDPALNVRVLLAFLQAILMRDVVDANRTCRARDAAS